MQDNPLHKLFVHHLSELYDAETQILQALPKLIDKTTNKDLKDGLEKHLNQTEEQVSRLEEISERLEESFEGVEAMAMKGLIKSGEELLTMDFPSEVVDVAIADSCEKVEHLEVASYMGVIELAKTMQHDEEAEILEQTLTEEEKMKVELKNLIKNELTEEANQTSEE